MKVVRGEAFDAVVKKNVDRLFGSVDQVLASQRGSWAAGPTPAASPLAGWYADPYQRHQSRY